MTSGRALLLIADMGGYTDYMQGHRFSLAHAEVNTARLLERVIDAAPEFGLVEIEGDAAFLSLDADGLAPEAAVTQVLRTAAAMRRAFHLERAYVAANLCPCSGCKEIDNLKLKFVAHVGDVATQTIRGRSKPVGIDVILVHRLLKNPVEMPEYVLMTEQLCEDGASAMTVPAQEVRTQVESIGDVRAYAVDVDDLDGALPPDTPLSWRGRLASTVAAAGRGMPYLLGLRRRRVPARTA